MGRLVMDPTAGTEFYFDASQRALFSTPAPGQIGDTGRNFFTGPSLFSIDMTVGKRVRITNSQNLELRVEMQNLTNTPSFGLSTAAGGPAVITSATFGRVRDTVVSTSRKVQLAIKYNF